MTARALLSRAEEFASAENHDRPVATPTAAPSEIEQKCAAVTTAAAIIAREGFEHKTAEIFAALVIFSGHDFPLKNVLGALPRGRLTHGETIVVTAMANLGFYVVKSSAAPKDLLLTEPAFLVRDRSGGEKFVVVTDTRTGRRFRLVDGARPEPFEIDGLSRQLRVVTFAFRSVVDPLSATRRGHTGLSWIAALTSRFRNIWLTLGAISFCLAALGVLSAVAISTIFSEVIGRAALDTLPMLAIGLILILVADAKLSQLRSNILSWVANRLEFLVNAASFDHILRLPPFLSERAPPAAQAARMRSFEGIRDFLVSPACPAALDMALAPFYAAIVAMIDWHSALVLVAAMAAFSLVFFVGLRFARVHISVVADEATEAQRIAIETFDRMQVISDLGLQHVWANRLSDQFGRDQAAQAQLQKLGAVVEAASSAVFSGSIILLMVMRGLAVKSSIAGGVEVLAMTILGLRCLLPFHTFCLSVLRIEQIRKSVSQVNEFKDMPTELDRLKARERMGDLTGAVSFVNVGFRAADTRPVFVGLDLDVRPGEVIGLHGAAGTGKSVILKMILGMMEIGLGAIRLDGVDIRQFSVEELRRRISYIPQQPSLVPGTIRDNLLFANPLVSDRNLKEVLRIVGLQEDIGQLASGLDHCITADEARRFGDEFRLRVAFARAILTNSKLVLIDEFPNSLMDRSLGVLLRRTIVEFRGSRTIIFVSHRADFLDEADRIVDLSYGGVPRLLAGGRARNERRA
ncbi:putative ABC transporter (ATP binding domain) [Bradyrhizobium sp. ORS 285]|uniref:ATP-binding cassette domain-containing protein n=1 Tax=Bradyrhizobium sp. ORS 285 TaxID=115808 RepID=UPI0002406D9F|nr:ATP-binding cassette domain-containing protein [Bradyrhizobium sp. ORS 285]CCD87872.1 putative ABC transporter (ATP binding domain) [Bradyrhizobium sp. ORS 285]SMX61042.1 putative ABC transporter (ATP binding domain) [Bradyrhizobium sp. ORS 285]